MSQYRVENHARQRADCSVLSANAQRAAWATHFSSTEQAGAVKIQNEVTSCLAWLSSEHSRLQGARPCRRIISGVATFNCILCRTSCKRSDALESIGKTYSQKLSRVDGLVGYNVAISVIARSLSGNLKRKLQNRINKWRHLTNNYTNEKSILSMNTLKLAHKCSFIDIKISWFRNVMTLEMTSNSHVAGLYLAIACLININISSYNPPFNVQMWNYLFIFDIDPHAKVKWW